MTSLVMVAAMGTAAEQKSTLTDMLRWHLDAGADEAIVEKPVNHYHEGREKSQRQTSQITSAREITPGEDPTPPGLAEAPMPLNRPPKSPSTQISSRPPALPPSHEDALHEARTLAHGADSLENLAALMASFNGCPLKATATNMVFGDGAADARVMFIGEAPGADEDRQGKPFVGTTGQLLDRMMAAISLTRESAYITNILPWRPPGNRPPTPGETAICLPFIERQIELVFPEILVLLGGPAAKTLLGKNEGIMKMRGKWFEYASPGLSRPVHARVAFHPDYLMKSPAHKRDAWRDFLEIKERISNSP